MSTKSVLLIGGSGFIGTHLAMRIRDSHKVFATYDTHRIDIPGVTTLPLDVHNRSWVKRVVLTSKPDVVVYAPSDRMLVHKNADFGELEKIHSKGCATAINCAEMLHPKFIYLSNCFVFDGDRGNYHESDAAIPLTPLGKAKMTCENFIRGKSLHSIIVRSSPVFGRGNGLNLSFLDRLRMQLDRGKNVEMSEGEIHSFAPVEGLVELLAELIAKPVVRNKPVHYGGLTKQTYADFAKSFATRFGYDPNLISSVMPKREEIKKTTSRPKEQKDVLDYSLNSTQAVELLKIKPFLVEESFDLIEKKLVRGT